MVLDEGRSLSLGLGSVGPFTTDISTLPSPRAISNSGLAFPAKNNKKKKMAVLVLFVHACANALEKF